jgi:hypothetical protein
LRRKCPASGYSLTSWLISAGSGSAPGHLVGGATIVGAVKLVEEIAGGAQNITVA